MTTKEYLSQIRRTENRIARIKDQLATIHAEMSMLKSPGLDSDRVQSSTPDNRLLDLVIKYEGAEKRLVSEMDKLLQVRTRICGEIESMDNEKYRQLLFCRYVKQMSWDDIADAMHYSWRWVVMLHGYALKEFERVHINSYKNRAIV